MSNIYGAETQLLGGGFGGWGGGYGYGGGGFGSGFLGGILGGALFGGRGGLFGGNNNCCCNSCCKDGHDGHHTEEVILDDAHYNSLQASIGGVKDNITALGYNIGDKFAGVNAGIAGINYNLAINSKDIIHNEDMGFCKTNQNIDNKICALSKQLSDCCCMLEKDICKSTQVIVDKLTENEIQALRDRLCKCEKDNDFFRFTAIASGNSFGNSRSINTGTQTSTSTNTNSGVIA